MSLIRKIFPKKNKDPYIPPPKILGFVGTGNFVEMGKKFLGFFTDIGDLKPTDTVVDIGCGNGRMAYPLRDFLTEGEYYGQEIVKEGVDWCQQAYSKLPNFHFIHADIASKRYNPDGKYKASEYRFPFEDSFADFVFLTSVFTHMLASDVENYVAEMGRFTKKGGCVFVTCFLINKESESLLNAGKSDKHFQPFDEVSYTTKPEIPESAVAYKEPYFMKLFESNGFKLKGSVNYGRWCGREKFTAYQDIVVFTKV